MRLRLIFYLSTISLVFGCTSGNRTNVNYNKNIIKAQVCMNNFYFYASPKSLDSAFMYLAEVKNGYCADSNRLVNLHMSTVYFLKGDYKNAIKIYESLDASEFSFPEYKRIIINKIRAKEAGAKEKYAQRMQYYSDILGDLDAFLNRNISIRDSILRLEDMSSLNELELAIISMFGQKYYYASKVKGADNAIVELDSLQRAINGNREYFEYLKKSVTGKDGYTMSVEFE